MNEAEFLDKLREAFAIEADEHFRTMSKCLADLEHLDADGRQDVIELIFREAHSLKGAARAINRADIEALCQSLESMFSVWKKEPRSATREQFDLSAQAIDFLADMLASDAELVYHDGPVAVVIDEIKAQCSQKSARTPVVAAIPIDGPQADALSETSSAPGELVSTHEEPPDLSSEAGQGDPPGQCATTKAGEHDHRNGNGTLPPSLPPLPPEIAALLASKRVETERRATGGAGNGVDRPIIEPARNNGNTEAMSETADPATPGSESLAAPKSQDPARGDRVRVSPAAPPAEEREHAALVGAGTAMRSVKDTIRVPISELESLYRQTEELSTVKFMLGRHAADLRRVIDQCREWIREYQKHRQSVLEDYEGLNIAKKDADFHASQNEKLQNFMKWTARQFEGIESVIGKNIEDGRGTMYTMETMADSMMDNAKQLLLLPFTIITDALPAMVRKIARDLGKEVRFRIVGEEVRIDKRILEALKDPLLHLLRNSLDHGLEDAAQRARSGKPVAGSITLTIQTAPDSRIEVLVEDDGRGIDVARVRQKAVDEGVISPEKANKLTEEDALELVFLSGITTSPIITDISGRGVGLNVVRENVIALGGEIGIQTTKGQGTLFRLSLPLSLSNARGVLVRSQGKLYVVPLQFVERGLSIHRENYSKLDGKTVLDYEHRTVTVRRLDEILAGGGSGPRREEAPQATVLLLRLGTHLIAVEVDEILWEQDVVIKPLPAPISRVRTVAGATLLSTGELVLVLQVPDLFDAARTLTQAPGRTEQSDEQERRRQRLLVVDDSITSRVLLHDILVSSGFEVQTAVDGIDALTHLREEQFDLIVSDVEMPRMNGFELTESVRKDEKLRQLPVVLVTGLETQEHRERGFDVGANAYINKSSFDQSNLIDVIERLI